MQVLSFLSLFPFFFFWMSRMLFRLKLNFGASIIFLICRHFQRIRWEETFGPPCRNLFIEINRETRILTVDFRF